MVSPAICAALCVAISMAVASDVEGTHEYSCNYEEIEICKDAALPGQCFVRCYKIQPRNCQVTCNYSSPNQSISRHSPDYQECKFSSYPVGECYNGACYWTWSAYYDDSDENDSDEDDSDEDYSDEDDSDEADSDNHDSDEDEE